MIRSVRWKTFAAWLGIIALAVSAITPMDTARASAPEPIVLCTGHGTITVPADEGGAPAGQASGHAHRDCCLHAPPLALAPHQSPVVLRRAPVLLVAWRASEAISTEAVFSPKQPRAPPVV